MTRLAAALLALGLAVPALAAQQADSASYVTLLGDDTLAVERFVVGSGRVDAEVVLRSPRTSFAKYWMTWDGEGRLTGYEGHVWSGGLPEGEPTMTETVEPEGAGYAYARTGARAGQASFEADDPVFPFIDMVHWPFELMLRRAHALPPGEVPQPLFSGGRVVPFVVLNRGNRRFGVRHPTRGTMQVVTDERGRMVSLDAGQTTRALTVQRGSWMEILPIAEAFAAADRAGRSFGALSGRGEAVATVGGATITLDYGTPEKRGRVIFGGLLEWGKLWRTGANRATHFSTDRDLVFGDATVPAGTYTLFTVPQPDGGVLMINRRTDINGQSYDPEQDLARVPMTHATGDEVVEVFTIRVRETDSGGVLELLWDRDVFAIPFQVR